MAKIFFTLWYINENCPVLYVLFFYAFNAAVPRGKINNKFLRYWLQNVSLVKKIDYTLNSELKKLQFFGAGPKTALPDTLVGDTG